MSIPQSPAAHGGDPSRFIYQLVPQAPPLDPRELEDAASAIEIVIVWGELSVLHVAHLTPPRAFYLGEAGPGTDFVIGEETLGSARLPLVLESQGELSVVVPRGAAAEIERDGERIAVAELEQQGQLRPVSNHAGANAFPLQRGITARIRHGQFTFIVRTVAAGQRVATARSDEPGWRRSRWTVASAAFHLSLLGVCYFLPPSSSALSMDRLDTDSRLVKYAIDAHENRIEDVPNWLGAKNDAADGGGQRAAGPEGEAGAPDKPKTARRSAAAGPRDQPLLQLTRAELVAIAQRAGIIGTLRTAAAASDAPASPYGRDQALGFDPVPAVGALLGNEIGISGGRGGLAMLGSGHGGGGDAVGAIGVGTVGTRGRSNGPDGDGYGTGDGVGSFRRRTERMPRIRSGQPDLHGSLSKEIIRRTIGRHINEIRFCYESQLITRPDLQGRVAINFVITPTGTVMKAGVVQSDLGDSKVESCIAAAVRRMDFPAPENGGMVIVTYPFLLSQTGG
jgi:TonB family protein